MPQVSVVMPVYNGALYLREAVDSVLAQTFCDFELIVIDDCSTDATPAILASYDDPRIRVLRNEKNSERSFSKNRGIAEAKSDLIAFLDADDFAAPERVAVQQAFLQANPHISVCSCFIQILGTANVHTSVTEHDDIKAKLLLGNPIAQSGVMLRKSALAGLGELYLDAPIPAEDYDLWARLLCLPETRFAIIPLPLVHYRLTNVNPAYFDKQKQGACFAYQTQLDAFGLQASSEEFFVHRILSSDTKIEHAGQFALAEKWLEKIVNHHQQTHYYNSKSLLKSVQYAWLHLCHRSSRVCFCSAFKYYFSAFGGKGFAGAKLALRMLAKFFYYKIRPSS